MSLFSAGDKLISVLSGSSDPNGPSAALFEASVKKLTRFRIEWQNPAAVTTTTAIAELAVSSVKQKSRLVGAYFVPASAQTGTATNFFTLNVIKRAFATPATPVNLIVFACSATPVGDLVAFQAKDLFAAGTIAQGGFIDNTATDLNCAELDQISVSVTKAGTGMTFPQGQVVLEFEPRD